jgi:hypothetical protein
MCERRLVRPTGFEPVAYGSGGRGKEATGGSVKALPPFFLEFSQARSHPSLPQSITDCHPFVTRLQARLPVAGPSTRMRDGHDQHTSMFDAVDDAEWKAPEQVAARVVVEARPGIRKPRDRGFGLVDFLAERRGCRSIPFRIPACCRFGFVERLLEIFKLAGHVRLPRGCADVPPPTESSWLFPRRRVRAAGESQQTTQLPRRRPLRNRGFGSARPQARLVPHPRVGALPLRAVSHP